MSRLFVCLWPPDHVIAELENLHRKDQVGARFVTPDRWHATLRFLGDADPNDVADALDGATFDATRVDVGPAVDIGGERVLFAPTTGTDELAGEVNRVTAHLGTEPPRKTHRGHITIARLQRRANMPRALGSLVSASWEPDEVALVESTLRADGPRYDTLRTWPVGQTAS